MTKTIFKNIILFYFLIFVVAVIIVFNFTETLPPILKSFVEAELEKEPKTIEILGFVFSLIALVGMVGIYFFAKWSRPTFIFGVVSSIIVTLFYGPSVITAQEAFIFEVGMLFDGFIIALIYFTQANEYFEQKNT